MLFVSFAITLPLHTLGAAQARQMKRGSRCVWQEQSCTKRAGAEGFRLKASGGRLQAEGSRLKTDESSASGEQAREQLPDTKNKYQVGKAE